MFHNLEKCILYLEKSGQLVRVHEEVDPYLEMAAIHMRVNSAGGPALLYENVKGSKFRAVSNLFGNLDRRRLFLYDFGLHCGSNPSRNRYCLYSCRPLD